MISKWPYAPLFLLLSMTWKNGGVSARRLGVWLLYVLRYTCFEPLRLAERLVYDRAIRSHELPSAPVFVLGHWRSGTSFLQTLLSLDPRFTTSTIYRSLFSDVFYLTEGWFKPILGVCGRILGIQYAIQRAPLDFDLPAEGDLALCCLSSRYSYTWGHVFPARFNQWMQQLVFAPSESARAGWLDTCDYFLRKLSYRAGGKRVVLKSPGDTARLAMLAERYPEATFIYIHRQPEAVFHSNRYLWKVVLQDHGVQSLTQEQVDDLIIENYAALLSRYEAQREAMPPERLVEVGYAALRDEPLEVLTQIYGQLGLGDVPKEEIERFILQQRKYSPQTYDTTPAIRARLAEAWVGLRGPL
jgi:hypothetical protein